MNHTIRYVATTGAAVALPVTRAMLLNLLLMETSVNTSVRLWDAVKIDSIKIWAGGATNVTSTQIELEWRGLNAPSNRVSDYSMTTRPAFISSSPPPASSDRLWSTSGQNEAEVVMIITCPQNAVIDVKLSARLVDDATVTAGEAPAAGTLGVVALNYLDGKASGVLHPELGMVILT